VSPNIFEGGGLIFLHAWSFGLEGWDFYLKHPSKIGAGGFDP